MTIDEAIQHCQEKVQEQAKKGCYSCASEHRQLAEWLKELKAYKEQSGDAISRKAAIDLADELKDDLPDDDRLSDMVMSHNEGILDYQTKLSLLPSVTQQPCDDAISRQAVLEGLASIAKAKAKSDAQKSLMGRVMFFTEQLPSVTPQQRTGRWIDNHTTCSECKWFMYDDITESRLIVGFNYCPNCGCKMEVEDAD